MTDKQNENPIWINSEALLKKAKGLDEAAMVIAIDLIAIFTGSSGQPIDVSNEAELLRIYAQMFPNRPPTAKKWRNVKSDVKQFFVEVHPDLWAPSPKFFVLNDPYSEGQNNGAN